MTREEQILIASCAYSSKGSGIDFEAGAKWSDANPKDPWILLILDAPYYHKKYLDSSDETVSVLVINDKGLTEIAYMIKEDGKWLWMTSLNNIVAWMPIPYFRYNHDHR